MKRVAFLTTHLAGSGHLTRTMALAAGVDAAGGRALVMSGGRPLPHLAGSGVAMIQLPPLHVRDHDYSTLRGVDGAQADAAYLGARRAAIARAIKAFSPNILVTELFPFGRRALTAEFEMALTAAAGLGAVCWASVRDLPEPPRKPERYAQAEARLRRWYRGALVHGDAALAPFSTAWAEAVRIADRLSYTGYVVSSGPAPQGDAQEVLVAEGGGALGRRLLATAARAARLGTRRWRLRTGGADAAAAAAQLQAIGGAAVVAEPAKADYRARLGAAAAAVSLCGYNTAAELLACGTPAVFCPMSEAGEREQGLRAAALGRFAQFEVVAPEALTPQKLAVAVSRAVARGRDARAAVDLSGVETTARILLTEG